MISWLNLALQKKEMVQNLPKFTQQTENEYRDTVYQTNQWPIISKTFQTEWHDHLIFKRECPVFSGDNRLLW